MVGKKASDLKIWVGCTEHATELYKHVVEEIKKAIQDGSVSTKEEAKTMKVMILQDMASTSLERDNEGTTSHAAADAVDLD